MPPSGIAYVELRYKMALRVCPWTSPRVVGYDEPNRRGPKEESVSVNLSDHIYSTAQN